GIVLRHPRARVDDGGRDPRQRLRHAAHDGLHRRAALHRRPGPDRSQLRDRRPARAARVMEPHVVSNLVVAVLVAGALGVAVVVRRSEQWRDAGRELWRRRPIAIVAVALYVAVALADSVAWVGGADAVRPRSLIDRLFPTDFQEASYSAPLADVQF